MEIPLYQVDAFARELFSGNPAAVCPLKKFLPDSLMQSIAAENNLAETAFFTPNGDEYDIRWFTPNAEVDLCGHATLATAYIIFNYLNEQSDKITLNSKSGPLYIKKMGHDLIQLDLPSMVVEPIDLMPELIEILGGKPVEMYSSAQGYLVIYNSQTEIMTIEPDFSKLNQLRVPGIMVSSLADKEEDCHFVSRFFATNCTIPEDPVTGSAHCVLTPFWAKRVGKSFLMAKQLSARSGDLLCSVNGDRVLLAGRAILYAQGQIFI